MTNLNLAIIGFMSCLKLWGDEAVVTLSTYMKDVLHFDTAVKPTTRVTWFETLRYGIARSVVGQAMASAVWDGLYTIDAVKEGFTITVNGVASVFTNAHKEALERGQLHALLLFGKELYREAQAILRKADGRGMTAAELQILNWITDAEALYREGYRVMDLEGTLSLVQHSVMPAPAPRRYLRPSSDKLDEAAGRVALLLGGRDRAPFYRSGVTVLPAEEWDAITEGCTDGQMRMAAKKIGCPVEVIANMWAGGVDELLLVCERLQEKLHEDRTGLERLIRMVIACAYDLSTESLESGREEDRVIFTLGALPNGVPALYLWRPLDQQWVMVVSEELVRKSKLVVTQESFAAALYVPSVACAYAGPMVAAFGATNPYKREVPGMYGIINKVMYTHMFRRVLSVRHDQGEIRILLLPSLFLLTRADHIFAEIATGGRVNRTLIDETFDDILVVANVLCRNQADLNAGGLVKENNVASHLRYSGRSYGRVQRLFPYLSRSGRWCPGSLLRALGAVHENLKNNRRRGGGPVIAVGDPRLTYGGCYLPAFYKRFGYTVGRGVALEDLLKAPREADPDGLDIATEFMEVIGVKMPNYMANRLIVMGFVNENAIHVHPAWMESRKGDFDGDQVLIYVPHADTTALDPELEAPSFFNDWMMRLSFVAKPHLKDRVGATGAFEEICMSKGLMGVAVNFWRQLLASVVELNAFHAQDVHAVLVEFGEDINALYGAPVTADELVAMVTRSSTDPTTAASIFLSALFGSLMAELTMQKLEVNKAAAELLAEIDENLRPEDMRTLAGQLKVIDRCVDNPIKVLRLLMVLDSGLFKKWMPMAIVAVCAICQVCREQGMTLSQLISHAPVGRLFHNSSIYWKHGTDRLLSLIPQGFAAVNADTAPSCPETDDILDVELGGLAEEQEAGNTQFEKRIVVDQRALLAYLESAARNHDARMSVRHGLQSIPTLHAVMLFAKYVFETEDLKLLVKKHRLPILDHEGTTIRHEDCYCLVAPDNTVYVSGILQRLTLRADEKARDVIGYDLLCPTCGKLVGYCEHTACAECGRTLGSCMHSKPAPGDTFTMAYTSVINAFDPKAFLAWQLTWPHQDEDAPATDVDIRLEVLRKRLNRTYETASSIGEAFNKMLLEGVRKVTRADDVNAEIGASFAKTRGERFDMVRVFLPLCPNEVAAASHPAYASVASQVKFGTEVCAHYHLVPTATVAGKPGTWFRHSSKLNGEPAFLEAMCIGTEWTACKRDVVRCTAERSMKPALGMDNLAASGFSRPPVLWDDVPVDAAPIGLTIPMIFWANEWNQDDQITVTKRFARKVGYRHEKSFRIRKGMVIMLTKEEREEGFRGNHFLTRKVLATDPTGLVDPVSYQVVEYGRPLHTVSFEGEFAFDDAQGVALEDGVITVVTLRRLQTGNKGTDRNGNKGNYVVLPSEVQQQVIWMGALYVPIEGTMAPSRFCEEKMQAGSTVIEAVFSQARRLMISNGLWEPDQAMVVKRGTDQSQLLIGGLSVVHVQTTRLAAALRADGRPDAYLEAKLIAANKAYRAATTTEEQEDALWPLAFHPVFTIVGYYEDGAPKLERLLDPRTNEPAEVMFSDHFVTLQPIHPEESNAMPLDTTDDRLLKYDRFGCPTLNVRANNSSSGVAFRENYAGSAIAYVKELYDELYSPYTIAAYDPAKVMLWELIASSVLQRMAVAFPEFGPQLYPTGQMLQGCRFVADEEIVVDEPLVDED